MEINVFFYFLLVFLASFFCTIPFIITAIIPKEGFGLVLSYILLIVGIVLTFAWLRQIYVIWDLIMVEIIPTIWSFVVVFALVTGAITSYVIWNYFNKNRKDSKIE